MTREELEAHIEIDEEADVMGVSTDEELIQQFKRAREEEDSPEEEEEVPTDIAVLDALKLVRSYAQFNVLNNAVFSLKQIENHLSVLVANKKKQSSIDSFFKKQNIQLQCYTFTLVNKRFTDIGQFAHIHV